MTARYFGVNSLAGAFRSNTSVVESTSAGKFDSTYVPNAIFIPTSSDYAQIKTPFLDGSTSIGGAFWFRFDYYWTSASAAPIFFLLNAGANAYRLQATSGSTVQFQYWNGSAWTNWGASFTLTQSSLNTMVLALTPNSSFTLYVSGTSVASGSAPTGAAAAVDEFRLAASGTTYFSQVMCADYDIRDAHLMTAALNGNSASNTGGTGSYTDVNETVLDETTAEVITTSGNKMGQTHAAITVPGGLGISGLIINARGRVNGGVITDGKLGVRSSSTNYSSSGKSYNGGYEPRSHIWESNPAGGAWNQTSFNAAETYLEAA